MLTFETLCVLSFGGGTPSTTLALMSCQNKLEGRMVYPSVPVYDAVIFCDLNAEPSWVYRQAAFVESVCRRAGIPFLTLYTDLYQDFVSGFGRRRVSSIPFWSLSESGKAGKMPRQCTCDHKIKRIGALVRSKLLCYRPREWTKPYDVPAHRMDLGILWEERRRAKESRDKLFTNHYPLVEMRWTRADCFAYNKEVWGLETWASACVFCPFHTRDFFRYLQTYEADGGEKAQTVDALLEQRKALPPLRSELFLTRDHIRLRDLTDKDGGDMRTFRYGGELIWDGF